MVRTYSTINVTIYKLFLAGIFLLIAQASIAAVEARIDRNDIRLGETLTLVLETADTTQSLEIDIAKLSADFIIIDTRNESRVSYVNGNQTAIVRVLYVLEPKRTGELVIPAFELGSLSTEALSLSVKDAPVDKSGEPPLVFVELELHEGKAYVHSQLALTVRLFFRYNLTEASLADPQIEHATTVKLNEASLNVKRNGVNYRSLERIYAVFPERSGELVIPEISFIGRVNEPSSRQGGSLFSPLNRGRRVRTQSESLRLMVEPRPAEFPASADWLPARKLIINSELKIPATGVRVGEPVTRIINMQTIGLLDTMMPDISWPEQEGARVYPDSPESVARTAGAWVSGRKTSSFAIVPEFEGELLLPEISIPWWDTIAGQLRFAIVPAEIVTVLPALAGTIVAQPRPVEAPQLPAVTKPIDGVNPAVPVNDKNSKFWRNMAIIGFALWLLTVVLALILRKQMLQTPKQQPQSPPQSRGLTQIKLACKQGLEIKAIVGLRQLAKDEPGIGNGLSGLAERCAEDGFVDLADKIKAMNQDLYSNQSSSEKWDGDSFLTLLLAWLEQHHKQSNQESKSNKLPPFYPE